MTRTLVVLGFAVAIVLHGSAERPPASANPCVEKGKTDPRLLPVDEASSNPEFAVYLARLRRAVERRDIDAVVEVIDPNIKLDFGGTGGAEWFRKLVVEQPERWEELRWVLAHGGSFILEDVFAAPYVHARWPDQFDPFECAAIVGTSVRLRSAPRLDAPIVTALSHSIVRIGVKKDIEGWMHVELGDGRNGYVARRYVRSPIEKRALFNRINGRWRMTAFVAGD